MDELAARAASAALALYQRLPDRGKPSADKGEFSVLAAIVGVECSEDLSTVHATAKPGQVVVFSLATGTKCCGQGLHTAADRDGTIVCDSHAEVLARRGFARYLSKCLHALRSVDCDAEYSHQCILEPCPVSFAAGSGPSVTHTSDSATTEDALAEDCEGQLVSSPSPQYRLKPAWRLFLYVSDNPCGDASIYPREVAPASNADAAAAAAAGGGGVSDGPDAGTARPQTVLTFTGAKLVAPPRVPRSGPCDDTGEGEGEEEEEDPHLSTASKRQRTHDTRDLPAEALIREPAAQQLGAVRTKSGRSDISGPFLCTSMSCSDKVCRWAYLGLQGALLAPWVPQIPLAGVVVDADPSAAPGAQQEALRRALSRGERRGDCRQCASRLPAAASAVESGENPTQCPACASPASLPAVVWRGPGFARGKCVCEYELQQRRQRQRASMEGGTGAGDARKLLPCGVSINWVRDVVQCEAHAAAARTDHQCADYIEMPPTVLPSKPPHKAGELNSTADSAAPKPPRPRSARLMWAQGGTLEFTLAQAGALLGTTKKALGARDASSRLCRRDAAALLLALAGGDAPQSPPRTADVRSTYGGLKAASATYGERKRRFLAAAPFEAWLVDADHARSAFEV